jgi:hypothetical protein
VLGLPEANKMVNHKGMIAYQTTGHFQSSDTPSSFHVYAEGMDDMDDKFLS